METVVRDLLNTHARCEDPLRIDCFCYSDTTVNEQIAGNIVLKRCRANAVVASAPISLAMMRAWRKTRKNIDVVHVHVPNPWPILLMIFMPTVAAVVVSVHAISTRYRMLQWAHTALSNWLYRRADAIIASSPANARVRELEPFTAKVHVMPYGVDPARLQPAGESPSRRMVGDERRPMVLFVGRLVYYKGLENLIAAVPFFDANLVILGDGPLYPKLRRLVQRERLDKRVRFIRNADDNELRDHLRRCTIFVLPSSSSSESFGLSMVEAMSYGKPVVVSDVGTGLDEVVRTAASGLIVPSDDIEALAKAIIDLLADPAKREQLGRNGRRAYEAAYTSDKMAHRFIGIYREVVEKGKLRSVLKAEAVPRGSYPQDEGLRIALAAAPGGHFAELLRLRPVYSEYSHFYITNPSDVRDAGQLGRVYWVPDYGAGGRIRRKLALLKLVMISMRIWLTERPNVLISTGPFTGFPLALLIRATGGRVIYVECSAQVETPSLSGRLYRYLANRFYVQWPSLLRRYPNATYRGTLL
jgi:glycosyltransferase involved in cell wall biosynthesis